jgi:hypothetical protein
LQITNVCPGKRKRESVILMKRAEYIGFYTVDNRLSGDTDAAGGSFVGIAPGRGIPAVPRPGEPSGMRESVVFPGSTA